MTETPHAQPVEAGTPLTDAAASAPRAHIRWGAIVWALIIGGLAATTLYITAELSRQAAFITWLGGLDGGTIGLISLLVLGGVLLVAGLLTVVRRAQRS